ncbi:SH3 domain-containing protein [Massilia sp. TSP1-1-2]|uniref:SH3 domain-containing protein n=1 Tax=unclassified Massilia TaxID=2609279 RepID=UPI003CEA28D3
MFNVSYLALAAFGLGLVATLVLAAWLTPARWWRQMNARALAIVVAGTWGIGSLVLWLMPGPAQVLALTPVTMGIAPLSMAAPGKGTRYRVHEDLNLRSAKGTGARRIAVVPAGSEVTTTGDGDGDWWQVSTRVDGKEVRGWSSSLWLRRADEARL